MLYNVVFVLFNEMSQLFVHIYPLPPGVPSHHHPPSHPFRSAQSTELNSLCQIAGSHSCFTHRSTHPYIPISQFLPLPLTCPHLCLYFCLANRFIHTIFLDSTYMHQFSSVQLLSHVRLCERMDCSTPGFPVHHQLLEPTQTQIH